MIGSNARRPLLALGAAAVVATACLGGTPAPSVAPSSSAAASLAAVTQPAGPVQLVIGAARGAGADPYARVWQAIIEKERLSPQPVQPLNKDGASGSVASTYVFDRKADMDVLLATSTSFFPALITQRVPYKATDLTPIANMAIDPFFLWVNDDSPWKTAQDFATAAKAASLVVAGTGTKQEDEALFDHVADTIGAKPFTFISHTTAGNAAMALAGHEGGVVATVSHPGAGLALYQAAPRKIRPLCAFLPDSPKSGAYAGLATCKSQGIAIDDYYDLRMVLGAPGLAPAQRQFWVDTFKKVYDSSDWRTFMSDNSLQPDFRTGSDLDQLTGRYQQLHQDIATKFRWVP